MKKIYSLIAKVILCVAIMAMPVTQIFAQTVATYTTAGLTTWTCPAGVSQVTVEVWGGGGGGGSSNNLAGNGGGGGGGGAYSKSVLSVTPTTVYNLTVGAAGAGGPANSTTAATAGGDAWFNTSGTIMAKGGSPGVNAGAGGAGGAAASGIGTTRFSGGAGFASAAAAGGGGGSSAGTAANGTASAGLPGGIAPVGGGNGGNGVSAGNATAGSQPGGGGGGSDDVAASVSGAGGVGKVVITYSTITSYSPTFACVGSTPTITINGTGFTGITSVTFNGSPAAWSPVSATQITATVPAGATTGPIQITTSYGVCFSTNFTISPQQAVSVSIAAVAPSPNTGTGPFTTCNGVTYYFLATINFGGTSPTIQWYDGATPIGTSSVNLTYAVTGTSAINCLVTYGGTGVNCPDGVPAASNTVAFSAVATPSQPSSPIGLSTVCVNQAGVLYYTSASNAVTYTWTITGGSLASGQGNDSVYVNWGGTAGTYPTAISVVGVNSCGVSGPVRNKQVIINPLVASPTLTIVDAAGGPTTLCQYASVNFSANITDPANLSKTAVWKVDGFPQYSATSTSAAYFTYPNAGSFSYGFPIAGSHTITCEITFNGQPVPGQCYSPNVSISNTITYSITQNEPPQVTIVDVANSNNICRGTLDVFTATPIDAGTPTYTWYVDGIPDASSTSAIFNYIPLTAGVHVVYCEVHSNQACDNAPPSIFPDAISLNTVLVNVDPCTYYVPATGNLGPYNACGGAFYDSSTDPGANYTNNQNGTVTFCSALPGQFVSITFTSMVLADNTDILRLYSGVGTGGLLLQTFQGAVNTTSFCGAVVSQDVSAGCITAWFQTGSSGVAAGWNGSIACSPTSALTPAGATCASPTVISALPYTGSNHTTQCLINDYTNQSGICNTSYNGEDHVYVYTSSGPKEVISIRIQS